MNLTVIYETRSCSMYSVKTNQYIQLRNNFCIFLFYLVFFSLFEVGGAPLEKGDVM